MKALFLTYPKSYVIYVYIYNILVNIKLNIKLQQIKINKIDLKHVYIIIFNFFYKIHLKIIEFLSFANRFFFFE